MYEIMMKLKYLLFCIPKTHKLSEYQATDDVMIISDVWRTTYTTPIRPIKLCDIILKKNLIAVAAAFLCNLIRISPVKPLSYEVISERPFK